MSSAAAERPAGSLTQYRLDRNQALKDYFTRDIFAELLDRTRPGERALTQELAFLGHLLARNLSQFSNVHNNRHSITNLRNVYSALATPNIDLRMPIIGATWVELGCGSTNPFAFSLLLLALGAKEAIPIDLEPIVDIPEACRTLVEVAKCLLTDPASIVGQDLEITPKDILRNLGDFDFSALNTGSMAGIPRSRLGYRNESVYSMSVQAESVDVVVSNAFLEHVPDADGAIKAMAGITKPRGYGVHIIDTIDHRSYGIPNVGPLDFLKIKSDELLVHGCNRLRPKEYNALFEKNGFRVLGANYGNVVSLGSAEKSLFRPPWDTMPIDDLKATVVYISVQRTNA